MNKAKFKAILGSLLERLVLDHFWDPFDISWQTTR